jgi:hypothetical protein
VPPLALVSLTVTPSTIDGQNRAEGRVSLSRGAPEGGIVVALESSGAGIARTPLNVTVAAGQTSASFEITTSTVTAAAVSTISATFAGVTEKVLLTVLPPAPSPSFIVRYQNVRDICALANDAGNVECQLDATASGGFPTAYHWSLTANGNRVEYVTDRAVSSAPTTCALFKGIEIRSSNSYMEIALRVERDGRMSADVAIHTVKLQSPWLNVLTGDGKIWGYCGLPVKFAPPFY